MSLVPTLTTLALADGIHLLGIGALLFYLGGTAPLLRSGLFLCGLMATHIAAGLLLLAGWSWLAWSPPAWWVLIEAGVVAMLLVLVFVRLRQGSQEWFRPPQSVTLPATFLTGVMVTAADLAVDLPYHLAAARIVDAVPTTGGRLAWLGYFNLLYALPIVAAAAAYLVGAPRVRVLVERRGGSR